jgi:ribonuclease-3 family protein
MNFGHYQKLVQKVSLKAAEESGIQNADLSDIKIAPERLPPLVLAYIGDAYFNMYVRLRLLSYEQNKVRILHDFGSKIVSAVMQAKAVRHLEEHLTEEEAKILRRGRNAKSSVPKSASVYEYRYSTGFEALVGYLFLKNNNERLEYIASESFLFILKQISVENREAL